MQDLKLIKDLLRVEAWAEGLRNEARRIRKDLEGVSTPSPEKGKSKQVAKVVIKRKHFLLSKKH